MTLQDIYAKSHADSLSAMADAMEGAAERQAQAVAVLTRIADAMERDGLYRFPPNLRASKASLPEQAAKVVEEAGELACEAGEPTDGEALLDEAWDVIYAAEGVLRMFDAADVRASMGRVSAKAARRGDVAR